MDNCVLFVVLVRACSRSGSTVVPLSPALPEKALSQRVATVALDAMVATPEHMQRARVLVPEAPLLSATLDAGAWHLEGEGSPNKSGWGDEGLRAVLFTSGTTGAPRAWGYPETALVAHAQSAGRRLGFDGASVALGVLPLHHAGGFMLLDRVDRAGAHLVLSERFDARETLRLMHDHGVTHTSWVPLMLQRVLDEDKAPPASLRSVLLGGDATSPRLLQRALDAGWPVYPSYGLTETCSQAATATPDEARRDPRTVGRPLAGVEVEVRDADGKLCAAEEQGRIVVKGATLAHALALPEGPAMMVTDDHGWLDDHGRLFVTGRASTRIVTRGYTVSALEVESVIEEHAAVAGAIVAGLPDCEEGQLLVALVEFAPDRDVAEEDLQEFVRKRLGGPATPRRIKILDSLPRTSMGKKRRGAVAASFSAPGACSSSP